MSVRELLDQTNINNWATLGASSITVTGNVINNTVETSEIILNGVDLDTRLTTDENNIGNNTTAINTINSTSLPSKLNLSGGTMSGNINMGNNSITNINNIASVTSTLNGIDLNSRLTTNETNILNRQTFNTLENISYSGIRDYWINSGGSFPFSRATLGNVTTFCGSSPAPRYTTDGITYTNVVGLPAFVAIASNGSTGLMAFSYGGGLNAYNSSDGMTFTLNPIQMPITMPLTASFVTFAGKYVMPSTSTTTTVITADVSGAVYDQPVSATRQVVFLASDGVNKIVTVGPVGMMYSVDSGTTFINGPAFNSSLVVYNPDLIQWMANDTTNLNMYISPDGINWTTLTNYAPAQLLGCYYDTTLSRYYFSAVISSVSFLYSVASPSQFRPLVGARLYGSGLGSHPLTLTYFKTSRVWSACSYLQNLHTTVPNYNIRAINQIIGEQLRVYTVGSAPTINMTANTARILPMTAATVIQNDISNVGSFSTNLTTGVITYTGLTINADIYISVQLTTSNNQSNNSFGIAISLNGSTTPVNGLYGYSALVNAAISVNCTFSGISQLTNGMTISIIGITNVTVAIAVIKAQLNICYETN